MEPHGCRFTARRAVGEVFHLPGATASGVNHIAVELPVWNDQFKMACKELPLLLALLMLLLVDDAVDDDGHSFLIDTFCSSA